MMPTKAIPTNGVQAVEKSWLVAGSDVAKPFRVMHAQPMCARPVEHHNAPRMGWPCAIQRASTGARDSSASPFQAGIAASLDSRQPVAVWRRTCNCSHWDHLLLVSRRAGARGGCALVLAETPNVGALLWQFLVQCRARQHSAMEPCGVRNISFRGVR